MRFQQRTENCRVAEVPKIPRIWFNLRGFIYPMELRFGIRWVGRKNRISSIQYVENECHVQIFNLSLIYYLFSEANLKSFNFVAFRGALFRSSSDVETTPVGFKSTTHCGLKEADQINNYEQNYDVHVFCLKISCLYIKTSCLFCVRSSQELPSSISCRMHLSQTPGLVEDWRSVGKEMTCHQEIRGKRLKPNQTGRPRNHILYLYSLFLH